MPYSNIDRSSDYFRVKTYTGNGADNRAITFDESTNMQPDFCWFKDRTGANSHNLFDVIRGVQKPLLSNSTSAELSGYDLFDSFNTNGFTVSGSTADNTNFNGSSFVNWSWKANGAGVSNTAGSISSTVSANTTSGFSVVSYTSQSSGSATIGHGLGAVPKIIICKIKDQSDNWRMYHSSLGNTGFMILNLSNAFSTNSTTWNNTSPTSTVFTLGTQWADSYNMITYCFAEVKGFSKFGSYTGNGSTDGTFVYTGMRPAFVMIKRTDVTDQWYIIDNKRSSINSTNHRLFANLSDAESTGSNIDILSNGFKSRTSDATNNASGGSYIYMAFAESPFVSSKGIPTTAR
jgi:hypothetical protein